MEGISQWLVNVKQALSQVSLEQSDLRRYITNTTFYINQEKKVCLDNMIIQHEFNVTYFKAVADLKMEINNFKAVADMKME